MKFGSMFSGGGGADLGLMAAGLSPAWAVEYDERIAGVYTDNIGAHVVVGDVRGVDYAALARVDWLHASPVCTRASVANSGAGGKESDEDMSMAAAVVAALEAQAPAYFTLENVWQYRNFAAFRLILAALERGGYFYDYAHVNAADHGVPQTRKRLILRAGRGLLSALPAPVAWVGWYAAVEDLLPGLPDSQLAPWQLARLPADLREAVLVKGGDFSGEDGIVMCDSAAPAFSVRAGRSKQHRAILSTRVVSMSPRCLARFQSFPDSYDLPAGRALAAKIIGNAVPPLLMRRVAESMIGGAS